MDKMNDKKRDEAQEAVDSLFEDQIRQDARYADGALRMRAAQDYEDALRQQKGLLFLSNK